MPSKRHSLEVDVTDCYHLSVDMLLWICCGGGYDVIGKKPGEEILEGVAIIFCCVWVP